LVVSGTPTPEELKEVWRQLYLEYCELNGEKGYNEGFELHKKINTINSKIIMVEGIVKHLIICYDQYLVDILVEERLKPDLNVDDDQETIERKLSGVISRAKKWVVETELLQKKFDAIQASNTKETGREYYDEWLLALSERRKYAVRATDITVYQFHLAVKQEQDRAAAEAARKTS
jgi:hypothetical protein